MTDGPFSGIRVVEWAHCHMGPGAGMFLADMGAEVIHVEQRGQGDLMRQFATLWGVDFTLGAGRNSFTEDLLRNKSSLSIDLSLPEGQELLHRFVGQADVFLTNMRQQAIDKYNMDYATLAELKPELIYCQGSGFGAHGPFQDSPGNEMMGLARSGFMLGSAHADGEPVSDGRRKRPARFDRNGDGYLGRTRRTGTYWCRPAHPHLPARLDAQPASSRREHCGQHWPGSASDPAGGCQRPDVQLLPMPGRRLGGPRHGDSQGQVCQALGDTELANDPRFATVELREQNRQELVKILDGLFGAIDYPEWERQATENDFISTRVNALTDLAQDPQVKANGYSPSCRTRTSANSPTWPRPWSSPKHRSRSAIARPRSVRRMSNCCRVGSA